MAIIKCPECGKEISDKATSCPSCGFPLLKGQPEKEKAKEYTVEINDSMYSGSHMTKVTCSSVALSDKAKYRRIRL